MDDRINLSWLIPVIGPFVVIIAMRMLWFIAGASWSNPEAAAFLALVLGIAGGIAALGAGMKITIRKWWIK